MTASAPVKQRTPAKNNTAEAKSIFYNGHELLLGHYFATKDAIHVNAGHLDLRVFLQHGFDVIKGKLWFFRGEEARHVA